MSIDISQNEVWFITGSQHLYGPEALKQVDIDSAQIAKALDADASIPVKVVFKPVVTTPDEIRNICIEANTNDRCVGLVCWMHTFSPAKMWIGGLSVLSKPFCHLHTQFNRDIPWADMDMDFMNLNQSAHGGREFGFICTRMRLERKVIVGHWEESDVRRSLGVWCRAASARAEMQQLKVVRFGDNMRYVAVTEGDKVEAEKVFGMSVNTHGVGDLVAVIKDVSDADVAELCAEYEATYAVTAELRKGGDRHASLTEAARIELGLRAFLSDGGYGAFTDTFEDLHGLPQLPGIAAQRLMADGYGFGAEGDWKHAALVRVMKVMAFGLSGGTSFMEDYTYHFNPAGARCLGAHMLEICPSIAAAKPSCEVHPLGIGGKEDPVRLVFDGATGPAINASLVDLGNRFRILVNEVEAVEPEQPLPKLPVARTLWDAKPDLRTAAAAWILAGGAHHTGYSLSVTTEFIEDFAEMTGVELVVIDKDTNLRSFKNELRMAESHYGIKGI
ncbi:L-arabinose isomerase [Rubellicoccus peritrichatus]|uniref:L-arabinose isomerase n=1 Tax=Rubellicoccus peritrichatus TaxID=3080537 RepID=A0AAQ3LB36_9BACT|nr:L-arabinose isomerase [Puniceicoccus sp. CR14]WOO42456.1 L-arabinose isomerase [Puniceicoccus sp. CR14]